MDLSPVDATEVASTGGFFLNEDTYQNRYQWRSLILFRSIFKSILPL
jgi:hypothetical protein